MIKFLFGFSIIYFLNLSFYETTHIKNGDVDKFKHRDETFWKSFWGTMFTCKENCVIDLSSENNTNTSIKLDDQDSPDLDNLGLDSSKEPKKMKKKKRNKSKNSKKKQRRKKKGQDNQDNKLDDESEKSENKKANKKRKSKRGRSKSAKKGRRRRKKIDSNNSQNSTVQGDQLTQVDQKGNLDDINNNSTVQGDQLTQVDQKGNLDDINNNSTQEESNSIIDKFNDKSNDTLDGKVDDKSNQEMNVEGESKDQNENDGKITEEPYNQEQRELTELNNHEVVSDLPQMNNTQEHVNSTSHEYEGAESLNDSDDASRYDEKITEEPYNQEQRELAELNNHEVVSDFPQINNTQEQVKSTSHKQEGAETRNDSDDASRLIEEKVEQ
ncbi:protein starmaker-like [Onthophagus taurus]|uniref:protein starmaker-like n=1 Tax=Onthophagus taurus TaxID=166361 RepID=UPI0039BE5326